MPSVGSGPRIEVEVESEVVGEDDIGCGSDGWEEDADRRGSAGKEVTVEGIVAANRSSSGDYCLFGGRGIIGQLAVVC